MSEHRASIEWAGGATAGDFLKLRYTREHRWTFDGGVEVVASSSPSVVPAPWSNPRGVDPEEAYVASIASCHMLTFLFVAARAGFAVASYRDDAVGVMTKTPAGVPWVSRVTLSPTLPSCSARARATRGSRGPTSSAPPGSSRRPVRK